MSAIIYKSLSNVRYAILFMQITLEKYGYLIRFHESLIFRVMDDVNGLDIEFMDFIFHSLPITFNAKCETSA